MVSNEDITDSRGFLTCIALYSLLPNTSLVDILLEFGPEITSDPDVVRSLLARYGITDANPPRDVQVVETMTILARHATEGRTICDVGSLVRALSSFVRRHLSSHRTMI